MPLYMHAALVGLRPHGHRHMHLPISPLQEYFKVTSDKMDVRMDILPFMG